LWIDFGIINNLLLAIACRWVCTLFNVAKSLSLVSHLDLA